MLSVHVVALMPTDRRRFSGLEYCYDDDDDDDDDDADYHSYCHLWHDC